jgi:hypothetical protein
MMHYEATYDQDTIKIFENTKLLYTFTTTPTFKGYILLANVDKDLVLFFCTKAIRLELRDIINNLIRDKNPNITIIRHGCHTISVGEIYKNLSISAGRKYVWDLSLDKHESYVKVVGFLRNGNLPTLKKLIVHPPTLATKMDHLRKDLLLTIIRSHVSESFPQLTE